MDEQLNVDFKVPELIFELIEHSNIIKYNIKSEKDALFFISEYNKDYDYSMFKTNIDNDYFVNFLKNNMVMIHSRSFPVPNNIPDKELIYNWGSVSEVVKFKEKYYLIEIKVGSEISHGRLEAFNRYLKEFNKLNKLTPLMLGV